MSTIQSTRPNTRAYHGEKCTRVRAVTEEDGEAFDVGIAKTVVKLDDGTEVIVHNHEIAD